MLLHLASEARTRDVNGDNPCNHPFDQTTMILAAPYLLSLCDLAKISGFSFGIISRLYTQTSTLKVEASRLIRDIVTFSPASESMAIEFLYEFEKVSYLKDLGMPNVPLVTLIKTDHFPIVRPVRSLESKIQPEEWAREVFALLYNCETQLLEVELKPVTDLATEYLNHLLIASKSPQIWLSSA